MCVDDTKLKRRDHVTTLETLRPGVKIANAKVHVDPAMLFHESPMVSEILRPKNVEFRPFWRILLCFGALDAL